MRPSIARLRCCPTLACGRSGGGRSGIGSTLSGSIGLGEEHAPTFFDNHLATGAEGDASRLTVDGGGGKSAVGIEHGNEALHDEVVDIALHIGEPLRQHPSGDDGVVIGDFGVVKHLFRLAQGSMAQGFEPLCERLRAPHVIIADALEDGRATVVHVVGQIGGVYTRIGGKFVFVELLDELQGEVGTIAILLVALHLQAGQVEESWGSFRAFLLRHLLHGEGRAFDGFEGSFRLLAIGESSFGERLVGRGFALRLVVVLGFVVLIVGFKAGGEGDIAIDGGEHPVGFGLEVLNLVLSLHDHGERGSLHAPYGEGLRSATAIVVAIFEGVEAGGIHAQEPVANGATESGFIESLIVALGAQTGKTFADGFFGHGGNPESFYRTGGTGFLHHPSLYEFSLLPGIAAVDDALGFGKELFDDVKLFFHAFFESYAEPLGHHGEGCERPGFPVGGILLGIFEFAEVSKGPRDLISVAFVVTGIAPHPVVVRCADDFGDVGGYRRFLSNTNYHIRD